MSVRPPQRKRGYVAWTREEKNKLQLLVDQNQHGYRIDWKKVQQEFPCRTKQQCKSLYMNLIKVREEQNISRQSDSDNFVSILQLSGSDSFVATMKEKANEGGQACNRQLGVDNTETQAKSLSKSQQGSLYFIARFYNFDWATVQATYYKQFTVEEIQRIHNSYHHEYQEFFRNLKRFESWDGEEVLDISLGDAQDVYNEVFITQFKLNQMNRTFRYQDDIMPAPERCSAEWLRQQLFERETYQEVRDFDFIDVHVLKRLQRMYDIERIHTNVCRWLRSNGPPDFGDTH